uniref:Nuclease HARBI1 n=1 Tax=Sparus aurata TaxID=8175 RepID=A0A671USV5_SPAAU
MALRRERRARTFRERKDVLALFDDEQLIKWYRLDRAGIIFVTDLIRGVISSATSRSRAFTAELKVITMLRYLATGKMQQCNADDLGPSQPSVSRIVMETIMALTAPHLVMRFIDFPTTPRIIQQKQTAFMQVAGFPGVVGAIDGTHVRIIAPSVDESVFVNRKRYHSINTQVEIRHTPDRVCRIMMACAILHNICKERNVPLPPADDDDDEGGDGDASVPGNIHPCDGAAFRQHFANLHFGACRSSVSSAESQSLTSA